MKKLAIIKTVQAGINDAGTVGHGNAGEVKGYQVALVDFVGAHWIPEVVFNDTDCPYGYKNIEAARDDLLQMVTNPPSWNEDTTILNALLVMTTSGNNYRDGGVADTARATFAENQETIWEASPVVEPEPRYANKVIDAINIVQDFMGETSIDCQPFIEKACSESLQYLKELAEDMKADEDHFLQSEKPVEVEVKFDSGRAENKPFYFVGKDGNALSESMTYGQATKFCANLRRLGFKVNQAITILGI